MNWTNSKLGCEIHNIKTDYSGYYTYDEQYTKIKGEIQYRLTLYDYILNIPVMEKISPELTSDIIKDFLKKSTKNKTFIH